MSDRFFSDSWHRVERLRPALRSHLSVHRHRYLARTWYVIDDRVTGKSHRVSIAAYRIIGLMDGRRTVDDLWRQAVEDMGEDAPSQDDVLQLLAQLHSADLLRTDASPDTVELLERFGRKSGQLLKQNLMSPTSFRIPLWDPDRFLAFTLPLVRPLFSPLGALAWLALVIYGGAVALRELPALTDNFSDRVLSIDNMLMMLVIYPIVKGLHELGHGYATKRFGAHVHETGIMFLVFFPAPYVDASGANAFRSKWQRATVAAAGIMVELAIAAVAILVWAGMEPGLGRAVAYNVVVVAGLSTLLVNGNPLLKFDGYFVLADLLEVPNLATRAPQYLGYLFDRYVFGAHVPNFHASRFERLLFVVYAPAAFIYRTLLTFGIALFVASKFFIVGILLALWSVALSIGRPAWKVIWHVISSPRLRRQRRRALGLTGGALLAAIAVAGFVPVPHATTADGVLWTPEEATVRAGANGFIAAVSAGEGEHVAAGTLLATLDEPAFDARLRVLEAQVEERRVKLEAQVADPVLAAITRLELEDAEAALGTAREQAERRAVRAAVDGRFEPIRPLANLLGRFAREGEIIGHVLPERAATVRAVVDQWNIDLVRGHLRGVELLLPGDVWLPLGTELLREVPSGAFALPSPALGILAGGSVPTDPRDSEGLSALARVFQFELSAPPEAVREAFGGRVRIKFLHDPEPLAAIVWRRARQLFLSTFDA